MATKDLSELNEQVIAVNEYKMSSAMKWARKYARGNNLSKINVGQKAILYYIFEMLSEEYVEYMLGLRHILYPLATRRGDRYTDWLLNDFQFKCDDLLKLLSKEESDNGSLGEIINIAQINDKYMLLHRAAEENEIGVLKYILKWGVDVDKSNEREETALHLAAAKGACKAIVYLIERGANIFALDKDGNVPFRRAIENFSFSIDENVLNLLEPRIFAKAFKTLSDGSFTTLLHEAAGCGNIKTLRYLLPYSNLYSLDSEGFTPLHIAVNNNYPEVVKLIIRHLGEWKTIEHLGNCRLLELAQNKKHYKIIEILRATELK